MDWRDDETMDFEVTASGGGVNLSCSTCGRVRYYPAGQDLGYVVIDADTHYQRKHGLDPGDVEIELCSSKWPEGGQHVGTLPTWVVATHKPTGLQAESADERSQLQNKAVALERLAEKVSAYQAMHQPVDTEMLGVDDDPPPPPPLDVVEEAITTIERTRSPRLRFYSRGDKPWRHNG